jgi:hypothetical protein
MGLGVVMDGSTMMVNRAVDVQIRTVGFDVRTSKNNDEMEVASRQKAFPNSVKP